MKVFRGFTLIELLVVIAIIGIIAAVVISALDQSHIKGRDSARKSQFAEILKGLELFYTDGGGYPADGTPANNTTGDIFSNIGSGFIGSNYFKRLPPEPERYQYCVSADRRSMALAVNTEADRGGSDYCNIVRGPGPDYGCTAWFASNASSPCALRF